MVRTSNGKLHLLSALEVLHAGARAELKQSIDPIDARDAKRGQARADVEHKKAEKARERRTLARVAREYHERVIEPSRSPKHGAGWFNSLETHVPAELWHCPIDEVSAPDLLSPMLTLQRKIPETASRVRQRLDAVFEDAAFHGYATTNPAAAIRRKLREAQARQERGEFRALPFKEAPAFMARLRQSEGIAARCLEFAVLTAARTGEVIGAQWPEFDLERATWTVPAARMKGGEPHVVFLSERALAVLESLRGVHKRWLFPSPMVEDQPISNMAMLTMLDRFKMRDRTTRRVDLQARPCGRLRCGHRPRRFQAPVASVQYRA